MNHEPSIVETISVEDGPHSVAAAPDGQHIYVTNFFSGSVSVIDTTNRKVATTFPVGTSPYGVAVNPGGDRVFVAGNSDSFLKVIDPETGTVLIDSGIGVRPYGLALSPYGDPLYIAAAQEDAIVISDPLTKTRGRFTGVDFPVGVTVSPDGARLYATHFFTDSLSVIDLTGVPADVVEQPATVLAEIAVGRGPYGVVASPDDARLYVAHFPFDKVSVIDLAKAAVVSSIPVPDGPRGVAISPDGGKLYVTNFLSDTVSVIRL